MKINIASLIKKQTEPKKIKVDVECPCCNRATNVRKDFDYPKSMLCCDDCGADFTTDGVIILNPKGL